MTKAERALVECDLYQFRCFWRDSVGTPETRCTLREYAEAQVRFGGSHHSRLVARVILERVSRERAKKGRDKRSAKR